MKRLALLLFLAATLAGCGVISDMADLQVRLKDAGYTSVSTDHGSVNGSDRLEVRAASSDPGHSTDQIAEIVWDSYPQHLDQVSVTLNGTYEVYSEDDLNKAFGDRQVTEKPDDDADTTRTIVTWLIVGAVVFLLFLVGLIVLIVFLVRRSRRTKTQQYPPPPGWPPAA
ncbi:hypothetical protein ACWGE0_14895 [Lentzea sp. NPDC054927]